MTPVALRAETGNPSAEEPTKAELLFNSNEGAGELRAIKEQIQTLLRQNEELAPELQSLEKEFSDLQKEMERSRAEVVDLEKRPAPETIKPEQKVEDTSVPGQPQSPRLLRFYDLQYEKKLLEIELRLKELALQEKQRVYDAQIALLEKELEQNTFAEKNETPGPKKQKGDLGYELECLKQENILLENQLKLLKTSPDLVVPLGSNIREKEAQKDQLQQRIAQLEIEQRHPSADANLPLFEKQFRGTVERLERENKDLKDRISSERKRIQERSP